MNITNLFAQRLFKKSQKKFNCRISRLSGRSLLIIKPEHASADDSKHYCFLQKKTEYQKLKISTRNFYNNCTARMLLAIVQQNFNTTHD